jgi:hypothetical protein
MVSVGELAVHTDVLRKGQCDETEYQRLKFVLDRSARVFTGLTALQDSAFHGGGVRAQNTDACSRNKNMPKDR